MPNKERKLKEKIKKELNTGLSYIPNTNGSEHKKKKNNRGKNIIFFKRKRNIMFN